MPKDATIFETRKTFCRKRLSEFQKNVENIPNLPKLPQLCIYVSGSYGRLEASENSDLDLFFVQDGSSKSPVSKIEKTLLDASLIGITRDMKFPEFSGYGEYLEIHYLEDMLRHLGSPQDDYENLFTARLLLLLESQPIYNNDVYREIIEKIIQTYYRDYHDHEKDFHPIFLVNDIIRFWKTLCLNYEHKRNRKNQKKRTKNKAHLRNLKLKYSRMLTCYSAVAMLCVGDAVLQPEDIYEIVQATPSQRLERLKGHGSGTAQVVEGLLSQYGWFLERTGRNKDAQIEWIADRENRDEAFSKARDFGTEMYRLLECVTEGSDTLRYVVI